MFLKIQQKAHKNTVKQAISIIYWILYHLISFLLFKLKCKCKHSVAMESANVIYFDILKLIINKLATK